MSFVATLKDLVIVILSEWSQTENEKQCMISLICGILKKMFKKFIYKTETNSDVV